MLNWQRIAYAMAITFQRTIHIYQLPSGAKIALIAEYDKEIHADAVHIASVTKDGEYHEVINSSSDTRTSNTKE